MELACLTAEKMVNTMVLVSWLYLKYLQNRAFLNGMTPIHRIQVSFIFSTMTVAHNMEIYNMQKFWVSTVNEDMMFYIL